MTVKLSGCPDPALLLAIEEHVLEPALEADVRQHLAQCATCRLAVDALREMLDREPAAEVRARIANRVAAGQSPRRTARWAVPVGMLAAAAAILLAVAVPDPEVPEAPAPPAAAPRSPLSRVTVFHPDRPIFVAGAGTLVMRSDQSARETLLARIGALLDDADAGRFEQAIATLLTIEREYPTSPDPALALGTTYLMAGRAADALGALERGRRLATGSLLDEFDWHLATAHVMGGAPDRARPHLVPVCEHGGPRSAVACAGLAEIGRLPAVPSK